MITMQGFKMRQSCLMHMIKDGVFQIELSRLGLKTVRMISMQASRWDDHIWVISIVLSGHDHLFLA